MKKLVLLAAAAICAPAAFGDPCVSGTLQDYINLGATGCQEGVVKFAGFTLAPGQSFATPIGASQVLVAPGGPLFQPQLQFTLNQAALAGELFELFFRFSASGPSLVKDTISLDGSATGDGAATATQDICPEGSFIGNAPLGCPSAAATPIAFATANGAQLSDSRTFSPTSFFDIFVDLTADGGLAGSATLTSATVQITAVPEPASATLLVAAFAAFALRRVRRSF